MARAAVLLLIALVAALTHPGEAQWRPNYQPPLQAYGVVNGSFYFTSSYSQFSGYFNNTWILPAGAHSAPLERTSIWAAACMLVHGSLSCVLLPLHAQARACRTRPTITRGTCMGTSSSPWPQYRPTTSTAPVRPLAPRSAARTAAGSCLVRASAYMDARDLAGMIPADMLHAQVQGCPDGDASRLNPRAPALLSMHKQLAMREQCGRAQAAVTPCVPCAQSWLRTITAATSTSCTTPTRRARRRRATRPPRAAAAAARCSRSWCRTRARPTLATRPTTRPTTWPCWRAHARLSGPLQSFAASGGVWVLEASC
jgi:hypothetical protein